MLAILQELQLGIVCSFSLLFFFFFVMYYTRSGLLSVFVRETLFVTMLLSGRFELAPGKARGDDDGVGHESA